MRTITVLDVDFEVEFNATPFEPCSWDSPASGGEVEVEGVYLDGNDVMGLLSQWALDQIQEQLEAIDHDGERREEAAIAKAEARAYRLAA